MLYQKLWILPLPGEQCIENTGLQEVYLYGSTLFKVALTFNIALTS